MKISTDSMLLGSWTPLVNNPRTILDIGSGTGIIALMLAQRTEYSVIKAIEMDSDSFDECAENFASSPWQERLSCKNLTWQEFYKNNKWEKYDLMVSNPPFYSESLPQNPTAKHLAKFSISLPFDQLIKGVSELLSENGVFCVILPFKEKMNFIELAKNADVFPFKSTDVKGNDKAPQKRSLLAFSRQRVSCESTELILEIDRNIYTKEYQELTKDFYL